MSEYLKILEDLQARREVLTGETEAVDEAIAAISRLPEVQAVWAKNGKKPAAVKGAFSGMTIIEAAKKYLASIKRPAPTTEIAAALERGGVEHQAKDFYASVYAILRQQAQKGPKGGIRRVATDWELIEEAS